MYKTLCNELLFLFTSFTNHSEEEIVIESNISAVPEETVVTSSNEPCSATDTQDTKATIDAQPNSDPSSEPCAVNSNDPNDSFENEVMVSTFSDKNEMESCSSEPEDREEGEDRKEREEQEDSEASEAVTSLNTKSTLDSCSAGNTPIDDETFDMNSVLISPKPVKVKSRWRRTSELEQVVRNGNSDASSCNSPLAMSPRAGGYSLSLASSNVNAKEVKEKERVKVLDEKENAAIIEERLKSFDIIEENLYLTDKKTSKEVKRMLCDCTLTKEEVLRGELGCGEDCINRLLMIEWLVHHIFIPFLFKIY